MERRMRALPGNIRMWSAHYCLSCPAALSDRSFMPNNFGRHLRSDGRFAPSCHASKFPSPESPGIPLANKKQDEESSPVPERDPCDDRPIPLALAESIVPLPLRNDFN